MNRNRLAWSHLVRKEGLSAGDVWLRERIGWIVTSCYLDQKFVGETRISYVVVDYSNGGIKPGRSLHVVCERDIDGKQLTEEVWSTNQHMH